MKTWEQEKAYRARRAQALAAEMEQAIAAGDKNRFEAAYSTAMRYMNKKERSPYYIKALEAHLK